MKKKHMKNAIVFVLVALVLICSQGNYVLAEPLREECKISNNGEYSVLSDSACAGQHDCKLYLDGKLVIKVIAYASFSHSNSSNIARVTRVWYKINEVSKDDGFSLGDFSTSSINGDPAVGMVNFTVYRYGKKYKRVGLAVHCTKDGSIY